MRISTENFYSIFFSELRPFWTYKFGQNERYYWKFVSAFPLKLLNRFSWNSVVMKDTKCRCAYPQEILINFFSRSFPVFDLRNLTKWKILLKHFVSATPLKPLNRIPWIVVVTKDLMCRWAYPQEILFQFFSGRNAPF